MKYILWLFLGIWTSLFFVSCDIEPQKVTSLTYKNTPANPKGSTKKLWSRHIAEEDSGHQGVLYSPDFNTGQYDRLRLDFYRPQGIDQQLPLIVFAHPGAFLIGDKREYLINSLCKDFCRAGYATASINYRLISKDNDIINGVFDKSVIRSKIMEAVGDARNAIIYLRTNAEEFNIDPDRIAFVGFSAGGIIGNHLAFTDREEAKDYANDPGETKIDNIYAFDPPASSLVKAVVAISGGLMDYSHTDDTDLQDLGLFMIHGENDGIVSIGKERPFHRYGESDIEVDLPPILFEIGFRKETISNNQAVTEQFTFEGIKPKIHIPQWVPELVINTLTTDICGSACLLQGVGGNHPSTTLIPVVGGDHSFMLDSNGILNNTYVDARWEILSFLQEHIGPPL